MENFFTPRIINYYREVAYAPAVQPKNLSADPDIAPSQSKPSSIQSDNVSSKIPSAQSSPSPDRNIQSQSHSQQNMQSVVRPDQSGTGSSFSIALRAEFDHPLEFLGNYLKAFVSVVLGPFPFQMRYSRHFFALFEMLPWYFLFFFVIKGILASLKYNRPPLVLAIFGFGVFAVLTLFINNFGIITRVRIPAFISLLCLIPLGFANWRYKLKSGRIRVCKVTTVDSSIKFLLLGQIKNLQKDGYEISAVCSPGKWIKEIESQGIKVKTIKMKRKISPFSDIIALFRLIIFFRKEKFDIIHTHTPKASFLAQLGAKIAGAPIIINTIHGLYFQDSDCWLKRKFFILMEKAQAFCSDLIFSVNREDIGTMIGEKICSPDLIKYSGDGINIARFNPEIFSSEFIENKKKELGINPSKKVVGIVARLVEEKGYLDLFEAFKAVIGKFPEALLLIVGPIEPEKKDAISQDIVKGYGIENNVLFLGERADVAEIYPLMDVFILPSHREGIGLSILEASAMNKPVVATNIRGCREAVDNGKTGILAPVNSPEKLAEAIIYLLENPEVAKEMGIAGREKIQKEFDERRVFGRIEEEYKRLLK